MPELPEVETIRLGLKKQIIGLTFQKIEVLNAKSLQENPQALIGQKIINVWRRAKVLGLDTDKGVSVLFHLKMTGQIIYVKGQERLSGGHPTQDMREEMPNKSTRVVFSFSDNSHLYFNDQRKFGWVKLVPTDQVDQHSFLKNLGPEPLEDNFTVQVMRERLSRRPNMPVKVAIMEQQLIAGVGNIYASEGCFNAKLDPRKKVKDLTDQEYQKLHQGIKQALQDGIKHGGSSRAHFVNSEGGKGYFLDYAYVYNREGQACKVCSTEIKKLKMAGRGTFLCEHCQI